ncbi:MAG TPA: CsgG/HfaB family protein [Thermodesulfobacteriota bacterium]|nr:CsgG/HfaB family protein [Thermodesulfobacteriota bacterium]
MMRKVLIGAVVLLVTCMVLTDSFAGEKPRIGVLRFTNETNAGWWGATAGRDLQDMLINELAGMKCFDVLERKELDAVIGEQDLGASGRIEGGTRAKIGKLTGAKYLVAATVSAFEQGTSGDGAGIQISGFRIGGDRDKAYMAVDLKVIEVDTGKIFDSRTVEATSKSGAISIGYSGGDFGGDLGKHSKTPTGKAIRGCVMEIAEYLECSMVKGKNNSCMQEYEAKEAARRDKTKGSIDLE